jgi:hypothetical protein
MPLSGSSTDARFERVARQACVRCGAVAVFPTLLEEGVMYANILVAVDGSEASKRAVDEGIRIAKLSGGAAFGAW